MHVKYALNVLTLSRHGRKPAGAASKGAATQVLSIYLQEHLHLHVPVS